MFAIYVVLLMLRWLEGEIGGLAEMARINGEKARAVYAALDAASPFYRRHAQPGFESEMNVVFRCPPPALDGLFCARAEEAGMVGTEGHRTLGGLRVSLYDGVSLEDARAISAFMEEFAHEHRRDD